MSITQITDTETRLTNTLRTTTEALNAVTAERDALRADAERYRKAAQMAVEMIETNAHERRHVRWALIDAMKGKS